MSTRILLCLLVLLPLWVAAQVPSSRLENGAPVEQTTLTAPLNATTLAVLHASQPKNMAWEEWLALMQRPESRSLYPLRVTPAMLDTLDGRLMDRRFQYVMVKE